MCDSGKRGGMKGNIMCVQTQSDKCYLTTGARVWAISAHLKAYI